jgi:threonine/homoserine/homoserine lactone efflux protein
MTMNTSIIDLETFLKGFTIGLAIAAPVGPIGLLTIRRTLAFGRAAGFLTGLGAASADAIFGSIAAFGITAISSIMIGAKFWLGIIGGTFLIYLGWQTFLSQPAQNPAESKASSLNTMYFTTFALVLTNPISILYFVGIIASVGAANNAASATWMVVGVFAGSALWWLTLASIANSLRNKINPRALKMVNQVSGAVIAAFGIFAVISQILES